MVQISAFLASWLMLCGAIWKLSEKLESVSSVEAKESLTTWLSIVQPGQWLEKLSERFTNAFDSIFGEKHFSWKCFRRSSFASIIAVAITICIWIAIRPNQLQESFDKFGTGFIVGFYFGISIITNSIPDYLSLLETRVAINYLKTNSKFNVSLILILDFLATILIASIPIILIEILADKNMFLSAIKLSTFAEGKVNLGIFFYSTFFTSIWLWLFLFSGFILRMSPLINTAMSGARHSLNIQEKPFLSIATISIVLLSLVYVCVFFPFLVLSA